MNNGKLKEKACKKAHQLAKEQGADYCGFGKGVTEIVLDEFASNGANEVTLTFEVSGVPESGKPLPCDERLGLELYATEQAAGTEECIRITVRGKTVTIC